MRVLQDLSVRFFFFWEGGGVLGVGGSEVEGPQHRIAKSWGLD